MSTARHSSELRIPVVNDLWYKNAVIYCLDVGTFLDANGDGIGDFAGLTQALEYLHGLGVTALWLTPFQSSPRRDHGYDVSDYYAVDPCFGTLGDFVEFTHRAGQLGMRVIIDLVFNHTSNQHPWFRSARSNPDSPYRDWYIWSRTKPVHANKGMVFPGVQQSTWSYDKSAKSWYFHRFYDFQPDLNTCNPQVQAEIMKIMGFWIKLGVHGFRMDAVPFFIGTKGADVIEPVEQLEMLRKLREFIQWRQGESVLLAEANIAPKKTARYFGEDGERMHMIFNFFVNQHLFYALASADTEPLKNALTATRLRPVTCQWAQFLRNHDELDLGRLGDRERQAVFAEFGPEPQMQLYKRGIRRRLATMLQADRSRLELAYSLMFTLPGTPVLRYGDEIGMGDDLSLPERESVRTPMQWSAEPNGGFTKHPRPVRPAISGGAFGYEYINVADQRRDPASFLNWMERIIRMRKEVPEIGWGDFSPLRIRNPAILGIRYEWRGNVVIILHNFSHQPLEIKFDAAAGERGRLLVDVLGEHHSKGDAKGRHRVRIEGYGYRWYRVGGLDYMLNRTRY